MGVMEAPLYKVLAAGQSCDGGTHVWSLPAQSADGSWTPGDWHELPASQRVRTCASGFHLTTDPRAWWRSGRTVYLAEAAGERGAPREDKVSCRRVRLLRPVTAADVARDLGTRLLRGAVSDEMIYGYGSGYGYGYGDGYGYGYGYGSGDGSGDGDGSGYGYGYGDGSGYGSGDGSGYGSGSDIVSSVPA